jgi:hypothetical protein
VTGVARPRRVLWGGATGDRLALSTRRLMTSFDWLVAFCWAALGQRRQSPSRFFSARPLTPVDISCNSAASEGHTASGIVRGFPDSSGDERYGGREIARLLPPRRQTPLRNAGPGDGFGPSFFACRFLAVNWPERSALPVVRQTKRASDVYWGGPTGAVKVDVRRAARPNDRGSSKRSTRAGRSSTASTGTGSSHLLRLTPTL